MSVSMALALAWIDRPTPAQPAAAVAAVTAGEAEEPPALTPTTLQADDPGQPQPAQPAPQPRPATVSREHLPAAPLKRAAPAPTAPEPRAARTPETRPARRPQPVEDAAAAPEEPRPRAKPKPPVQPRTEQARAPAVAGMITPSMLRRLSSSLNLTPEQRVLYQPLERALLAIGSQQAALLRTGQDPKDAFSLGTAMSMYGVAQPFLGALREEQKTRLRAEARNLGFGFAAEQI